MMITRKISIQMSLKNHNVASNPMTNRYSVRKAELRNVIMFSFSLPASLTQWAYGVRMGRMDTDLAYAACRFTQRPRRLAAHPRL